MAPVSSRFSIVLLHGKVFAAYIYDIMMKLGYVTSK